MAAPDAGGGGLHGAAGVAGVRAAGQPVRAAQVRSAVVACTECPSYHDSFRVAHPQTYL